MKWLSALMGIVLIDFAAVQYNDPDAARWIAIYALGSLVSFAAAFGRCPAWLAASVALVFLLWSMSLWPALLHMRMESFTQMYRGDPTDEEVRESLGLFIGAAWCGCVYFWVRRRSSPRSTEQTRQVAP